MPVLQKIECCSYKLKQEVVLVSSHGYNEFKRFVETGDKERHPFRREYFGIYNQDIGLDDDDYKVMCFDCMEYWMNRTHR